MSRLTDVSHADAAQSESNAANRPPRRILSNYMMWRVTLQSFAVLGRKWRDLAQEYNKVITGQDREEPRWEQCMASLTGSLGIALSSLYVRNHFKGILFAHPHSLAELILFILFFFRRK